MSQAEPAAQIKTVSSRIGSALVGCIRGIIRPWYLRHQLLLLLLIIAVVIASCVLLLCRTRQPRSALTPVCRGVASGCSLLLVPLMSHHLGLGVKRW